MRILFIFFLLAVRIASFGQSLPTPRNIQLAYDKGTRSTSGAPGKNYWQNEASYTIHVEFSPDTRLIRGTVQIEYFNHSPDKLNTIWFKLYPNLFKKGVPHAVDILPDDIGDGLTIDKLAINGKASDSSKLEIDGTNMVVSIPELNSGGKIAFEISYHYVLNKGGSIRTGEVEPNADFLAYFFPRIAVYDDIDGWNRHPYLGVLEFYNDFCHFDVYIKVPKNFVVWATGDLKNCSEVLSEKYCRRIEEAEKNDAIVYIVDSNDLKTDNITNAVNDQNVWHYEAGNVTDFVVATSDHYVWKSTSLVVDPSTKRRTRVDAVFNPQHLSYFEVVEHARKTVEAMSYRFPTWPFPYAHETIFDGLDQMEYPMMVNDNPISDRAESIELTDHEIFHTMFPFYVGTNETKYAWMDEGWGTLGEWLISPMIDSSIVDEYGVKKYSSNLNSETDLPIVTLSSELNASYFTNSYPKAAMGYLYVKDLLGDSLFKKALHHYIKRWHGKHPMPNDFFYSMNEGAGRNLNWFWKKWFFEGGDVDLSIRSAKRRGRLYDVLIVNKGTKPVPVNLVVQYTDNSTEIIHRSIAIWEKGNQTFTMSIPASKTIRRFTITDPHVPDSDNANNLFEMK